MSLVPLFFFVEVIYAFVDLRVKVALMGAARGGDVSPPCGVEWRRVSSTRIYLSPSGKDGPQGAAKGGDVFSPLRSRVEMCSPLRCRVEMCSPLRFSFHHEVMCALGGRRPKAAPRGGGVKGGRRAPPPLRCLCCLLCASCVSLLCFVS